MMMITMMIMLETVTILQAPVLIIMIGVVLVNIIKSNVKGDDCNCFARDPKSMGFSSN